jgi:hypothetical protein
MAARKYILLLYISLSIIVQFDAKAHSYQEVEYPWQDIDTLDFGLCYWYEDSLQVDLNIFNQSGKLLTITPLDPSWQIGEWPNDLFPKEFEEFYEDVNFDFTQLVANQRDTLPLFYKASRQKDAEDFLNWYKKHAIIKVGYYDPNLFPVQQPVNITDYDYHREYRAIARKTRRFMDGYEKECNFDSVHINPLYNANFRFNYKNVIDEVLEIYEIEVESSKSESGADEFHREGLEVPRKYDPDEIRTDILSYRPLDTISPDKAIFTYRFYPIPGRQDTTDEFSIELQGIAVEQGLKIIDHFSAEADVEIKSDTVDMGYLRVGDAIGVRLFIENSGNVPYGPINHIWDKSKSLTDADLQVTRGIGGNGHLAVKNIDEPRSKDTLDFTLKLNEKGSFLFVLNIVNDIYSRDIKGAPPGADTTKIYIKGLSVVPQISVMRDTVDFGNIYLTCPQSIDTLFYIANSGNTDLEILDILVEDRLRTVYSVSREQLLIPAKQKDSVTINLTWADEGQEFDSEMIIVSNAEPPNDTVRVALLAAPTDALRMVPQIPKDIKSRPGSRIRVPILVDPEKIILSNGFIDTLYFDEETIRLESYSFANSAADGVIEDEIMELSGGRLAISLQMSKFFHERDTLLKMYFDTYLGSKKRTDIVFSNPKFSDNNCENIFRTDSVSNGVYTIDSVCGLDYKLKKVPTPRINSIFPNPGSERISVDYFLPQDSIVTISLYSSMGKELKVQRTEAIKGDNVTEYELGDLQAGIYYLAFEVGKFRKVRAIAITD